MSTNPKPFLTPEQYLEVERKADYKSEFHDGEMFAMSGASLEHNQIVVNLISTLHTQLRDKSWEVLPSNMRVYVPATGLYTYPDLVVVCGEPQLQDTHFDTLLNPTLLIEVLSPSTEAYDGGLKFDSYKTIESLKQYLLVATGRIHADLITRQPGGWVITSADGLDGQLDLLSIGCRLTLSDVYEDVEFPSR